MTIPAAHPLAVAIRGPLRRADLPELYERVCALLKRGAGGLVLCDVSGVAADAVAVDALARLALAARRHGCQVRFMHGSGELRALVTFMGLAGVLPE
jgi:ABC-type transporter Mla MlaB component